MKYLHLTTFLCAATLVATASIKRASSQDHLLSQGWSYQQHQPLSGDPFASTHGDAIDALLEALLDGADIDSPYRDTDGSDRSYSSSFSNPSYSLPVGYNQPGGMVPPGNQGANGWQVHSFSLHGGADQHNSNGFSSLSYSPILDERNSVGTLPFTMPSNQGVDLKTKARSQDPVSHDFDHSNTFGDPAKASTSTLSDGQVTSLAQPSIIYANGHQSRLSHQSAQSSGDSSRPSRTTRTAKSKRKTGRNGSAHDPHLITRSPSTKTTKTKRKNFLGSRGMRSYEFILDVATPPLPRVPCRYEGCTDTFSSGQALGGHMKKHTQSGRLSSNYHAIERKDGHGSKVVKP